MSAATVTYSAAGRVTSFATLAAIPITVTGSSTTYTTTLGGLPFDLTGVLGGAGPFESQINPSDIIGIVPLGLSTSGYLPTGFTLGTPTWSAVTGSDFGTGLLATCPVTCRLIGIGTNNSSHSALGEVADGANSDAFTALLLVARGGQNK